MYYLSDNLEQQRENYIDVAANAPFIDNHDQPRYLFIYFVGNIHVCRKFIYFSQIPLAHRRPESAQVLTRTEFLPRGNPNPVLWLATRIHI